MSPGLGTIEVKEMAAGSLDLIVCFQANGAWFFLPASFLIFVNVPCLIDRNYSHRGAGVLCPCTFINCLCLAKTFFTQVAAPTFPIRAIEYYAEDNENTYS